MLCTATTGRARSLAPLASCAAPDPEPRRGRGHHGGLTIAATPSRGSDAVAFEVDHLALDAGIVLVRGRWYGVGGHRFVRPALILTTSAGEERRLLAELDDKPWVAEDGESWQAAFALDSPRALETAVRLELSVAPDINVALRSEGVAGEGQITATPRPPQSPPAPMTAADGDTPDLAGAAVAEPADPVVPRDPPAPWDPPLSPGHGRARGVPAPSSADPALPQTLATGSVAGTGAAPPRPRPAQSRAPDLERVTARLRAAEDELEREHALRRELEASLEREQAEAVHVRAELARVRAELELARTAEREAAETAALLDTARREHHELGARHEALRAGHERALRAQAELEEQLEARTTALTEAREALSGERRGRREAESRVADGEPGAAHRPGVAHGAHHVPPPPRTDRPLNPSLRQNPWLRLLVVIVLAAVLFAVYLVLHSTVLH